MSCHLMKFINLPLLPELHHSCGNCLIVYNPVQSGENGSQEIEATVCFEGKNLNMIRNALEPSSKFINRVLKGIENKLTQPFPQKKKKRKDLLSSYSNDLNLTCQPSVLKDEYRANFLDIRAKTFDHTGISCLEALRQASSLCLFFRNKQYVLPIIWSPLTVTQLTVFNTSSTIGIPILLSLTLKQGSSVDFLHQCNFLWWEVLNSSDHNEESSTLPTVSCHPVFPGKVYSVSCEGQKLLVRPLMESKPYFVPKEIHQHKTLFVSVSDLRFPCLYKGLFIGQLNASQEHNWRNERLDLFRRVPDKNVERIRIASFNLLAPEYARTPQASTVLFPYCPGSVLDYCSRLPRLLSEILELDCDVFGLQECSEATFKNFFIPCLSHRYTLHFTCKKGNVPEGLCLLFDTEMFEEVEFQELVFKSLMNEYHSELLSVINTYWPDFDETVLSHLTTVFQLGVLKPKSLRGLDESTLLIVGNTHLFFHPHASHIRILQIYALLCYIAHVQSKYAALGFKTALVALGDFNSVLTSGGYEFLSTQRISAGHSDWACFNYFTFGDLKLEDLSDKSSNSNMEKGKEIKDTEFSAPPELNLSWPKNLSRLEDTYLSQENRVTHIVNNFYGTLDYIFISCANLKLIRVLPLASWDSLTQDTGLPSIVYPSDHLSLAVEVQFQ